MAHDVHQPSVGITLGQGHAQEVVDHLGALPEHLDIGTHRFAFEAHLIFHAFYDTFHKWVINSTPYALKTEAFSYCHQLIDALLDDGGGVFLLVQPVP